MIQKAIILVVALLGAAVVAQAQPAPQGHRMGVLLHNGAPPGLLETFREGLHELGYREGQNLAIEVRDAAGKNARLSALVDELLRLKVDVILAVNTPAAQAAKKATATVPVVFTRIGDPVRAGLVASLARPGGNVTGLSFMHTELSAKRLELLRELLPGLASVVGLFNADNPSHTPQIAEMEQASSQLGLAFLSLPVRGPSDFPGAFQAASRARAEVLIVLDDTTITQHRGQILQLAATHALPVVSRYKDFTEAGGLIAYGPSLPALYRRAAYYVDRILQGAKPADLPVEQPMKFELVINLKTAQALGLTIPPHILFQADEVLR
jgi:putative tryptophan/tyrosine transport system substrate-binding protein